MITHLRSIRLGDPDPMSLATFYSDTWGLTVVSSDDKIVLLRGSGREHHVLSIEEGDSGAMGLLAFGADSVETVDDIATRVRTAGSEILCEPGPRVEAGGGYAVRFRDGECRVIEVSADVAEHPAVLDHDGPVRLSHVVLNAPDIQGSNSFFHDVLGFRTSDWYQDDLMIFLRCNSTHHCIVLTPNEFATINHVAFEVDDVDAVMRAMGRMRACGLEPVWGPGRHGPGGNVFNYFVDPAGTVIEYTAELFEVDDSWIAREWARTPENADTWGTGGGISQRVRDAMRNPPQESSS